MADIELNTSLSIEERTKFLRDKVDEIKEIHKKIISISTVHKEQLALFRFNKDSLANAKGSAIKLAIEESVFAPTKADKDNARRLSSNPSNNQPEVQDVAVNKLEMQDLVSAQEY